MLHRPWLDQCPQMLLAELEERQKFEKGQRETAEERWEAMRKQMMDESQGLKETQQVGGDYSVSWALSISEEMYPFPRKL